MTKEIKNNDPYKLAGVDIEAGNSMNLSTVKVDNKYTLASWTRSLSNINS